MISVLKTISAGAAGLCLAVWIAAVGISGNVSGEFNPVPYTWIWGLGVGFLLVSVIWLTLQLEWWPNQRGAKIRDARDRIVAASQVVLGRLRQSKSDAPGIASTPASGFEPRDLVATIRVSDLRYAVHYGDGIPVGTITPHKGLFEAQHFRVGHLGDFESVEAARYAIWRADS